MKLIRRTTLRFQDGSSDKVYEVDIVEKPLMIAIWSISATDVLASR